MTNHRNKEVWKQRTISVNAAQVKHYIDSRVPKLYLSARSINRSISFLSTRKVFKTKSSIVIQHTLANPIVSLACTVLSFFRLTALKSSFRGGNRLFLSSLHYLWQSYCFAMCTCSRPRKQWVWQIWNNSTVASAAENKQCVRRMALLPWSSSLRRHKGKALVAIS